MFCGTKSSLFEREVENIRVKRNINLKGLDHCSYYIHQMIFLFRAVMNSIYQYRLENKQVKCMDV